MNLLQLSKNPITEFSNCQQLSNRIANIIHTSNFNPEFHHFFQKKTSTCNYFLEPHNTKLNPQKPKELITS